MQRALLLAPMDLGESLSYLRHHLALVGRTDPLFADDAVALGSGRGDGYTRKLHPSNAHSHLLLRSALAVPARKQREHERSPGQYLPKGSDLSAVSPGELRRIQRSLNTRPRQTLAYRTPHEKMSELVALTA